MILEETVKISEDSYMGMESISGLEIVKDSECEFIDILPVSSVNLSLFDSSIHFHNEGFTETSSSSDQTEDEEMASEIHTPTENIFDPFAPCTDDLIMLAPKKKKLRDSNVLFRRQLDFDSECDSRENVEDDEEQFLELVHNSLFELIISTQLKEISDAAIVVDSDFLEECRTPLSLPLLPGIVKTCPLAPMRLLKPSMTLERKRHNLCRKLDF